MDTETTAQQENQEKTFTTEEVNRIVQERLARAKAEPPADYESLKKKAAAYDEAQEAAKTELQKAQELAAKLQAENDSMKKAQERAQAVHQAASSYKVDEDLLSRMSGDVEQNAQLLQQRFAAMQLYPERQDQGETKATMTKDSILAIEDPKARLQAIKDNIEIF